MTRPRRLLILDDDREVVDFLCESLSERGYDAVGLTAPAEALVRLRQEDFDMVVSDIEMPDLRGTELLAAIAREKPTQLVLLITAFGSIDLAVATVKAGACDFIAKPFKIEALVHAIERAFKERQLHREIVRLRAAIPLASSSGLIAESLAMRKAMETARRASRSKATVLLSGETGTGKTVLARFIHDTAGRPDRPFVQINCAALPSPLVESELFGVRRGAYTDAREDRQGVFVAASGGSLLLDEVGELPLEAQAKLLHVLESGKVRPLGSAAEVSTTARVIAATNQPLEALLRSGQLRPDLYYRLNVIRIEVPPLRERRDDILPLVDLFLGSASQRHDRPIIGVSAPAMRRLTEYRWPGNVRQLANLIERAVALCEHDTILPEDLDFEDGPGAGESFLGDAVEQGLPLEDLEREYVRRILDANGGNKAAAARVLGINRRTLYRKIEG
jgi:DNA-binding NtrC family response regulator